MVAEVLQNWRNFQQLTYAEPLPLWSRRSLSSQTISQSVPNQDPTTSRSDGDLLLVALRNGPLTRSRA